MDGSPVGEEVAISTISASRTASSSVSTIEILVTCGYSARTNSAKLFADGEVIEDPLIFTVSIDGRTAIAAANAVLLMTPGPMMPTTLASSRAKCLNPTPGTAPVR